MGAAQRDQRCLLCGFGTTPPHRVLLTRVGPNHLKSLRAFQPGRNRGTTSAEFGAHNMETRVRAADGPRGTLRMLFLTASLWVSSWPPWSRCACGPGAEGWAQGDKPCLQTLCTKTSHPRRTKRMLCHGEASHTARGTTSPVLGDLTSFIPRLLLDQGLKALCRCCS